MIIKMKTAERFLKRDIGKPVYIDSDGMVRIAQIIGYVAQPAKKNEMINMWLLPQVLNIAVKNKPTKGKKKCS